MIDIRIVGPKEISTSQTLEATIYGEPMDLKSIHLSNTGAVDRTVTMWLKPQEAVSILASHKLLGDVAVLANDIKSFKDLGIPLHVNDKFYFQADDVGVNLIVSVEDKRA